METPSPPSISNFDLHLEVKVLEPVLPGAYINKIQQIGAEIFKFKLSTKAGLKDLIVILGKALFITDYSYPAPIMPSNYSRFLRKRLESEKIVSIRQHNLDRVCYVETTNYYLIFELFSSGNIILTNKEWIIESVFHPHKWKDRDLHPKEKYVFPASSEYSVQTITEADLKKMLDTDKTVAQALIKSTDLGPFYAEEICRIAKVDKSETANNLDKKKLGSLFKAIQQVKLALETPEKVYSVKHKDTIVFIPVKPENLIKEYPDMNAAIDEGFLPMFISQKQPTKQESKVATLEHRLKEQEESYEKFEEQALLLKEKGDLIYSNYDKIHQTLSALKSANKNEEEWEKVARRLEKELHVAIKQVRPKASKVVVEL
ncbi:MAG: NFACT family protein [Candidatus Diapherotrites archaeon]|nr:NFACT family protein [Candidatus Diapherotrites archaeon]